MKSEERKIFISGFFLQFIALIIAIIGTVYMFSTDGFAEEIKNVFSDEDYTLSGETLLDTNYSSGVYLLSTFVNYKNAGIMPLVGSVTIGLGVVFLFFAYRFKNKRLAIGTIVCNNMATVVLFLSLIRVRSFMALIGYYINIGSGTLLIICNVLFFVFMFSITEKNKGSLSLRNGIADLKELKMLLDSNIITQKEFDIQKQKIMTELEMTEGHINLSGKYRYNNTTLFIKNSEYRIELAGEIIKSGNLSVNNNGEVVLTDDENGFTIFKIEGTSLVSATGLRYDKV